MGMFDSFMVEIEDQIVELQTKHFDCVLYHYQIGDVVGGAPGGVRVYLDKEGMDAEGKHTWRDEEVVKHWTVLLVLAHGVFVDYEIEAGELETDTTLQRIKALQDKWEDTARLLSRLIQFVSDKQNRVDDLCGRINHARSAINEARRLRTEENPKTHPLLRIHEYVTRLERGDDPLDVVEYTLGETGMDLFVRSEPKKHNPLEGYWL